MDMSRSFAHALDDWFGVLSVFDGCPLNINQTQIDMVRVVRYYDWGKFQHLSKVTSLRRLLELEMIKGTKVVESNKQRQILNSLLSPDQAREAFKQAKQHTDKTGQISYHYTSSKTPYKQYEIIVAIKEGQPVFFAIDKKRMLGKGGQGAVYLAQQIFHDESKNSQNNLTAVKVSHNAYVDEEFENEKTILEKLGRFKGKATVAIGHDKVHYLFSQYYPGKNLLDYCYNKFFGRYVKKDLPPLEMVKLIRAVMLEVQTLHQEYGILHRDLKPENFIISESEGSVVAKLIDFGSSCLIQRSTKVFCGTIGYQPPEVVESMSRRPAYNIQAELYSLGVVIAEIVSAKSYQSFIISTMKRFEKNSELGFIYPKDIRQALFDVFQPLHTFDQKDSWDYFLCKMIFHLTKTNANARPLFNTIEKYLKQLHKWEISLKKHKHMMPLSARGTPASRLSRSDDLVAELQQFTINHDRVNERPSSARTATPSHHFREFLPSQSSLYLQAQQVDWSSESSAPMSSSSISSSSSVMSVSPPRSLMARKRSHSENVPRLNMDEVGYVPPQIHSSSPGKKRKSMSPHFRVYTSPRHSLPTELPGKGKERRNSDTGNNRRMKQ